MKSYWDSSETLKTYPKLEKDIETDICIVGAGIVGITCAYTLGNLGYKVCILEKDKVFNGVSVNTTAKITSEHSLTYNHMVDKFGMDKAKQYLYANENAIRQIENIIKKENIECDFEIQSSYVYTTKQEEIKALKQELKTLKNMDFDAQYIEEIDLPFSILGAVKFNNQAQFNPKKYVKGLLKKIEENEGEIYENTKVIDITNDCITIVETNDIKTIKVKSKYVIMATHYPIINAPGYHFLKLYQEKSYAIAIETEKEVFNGIYINPSAPTYSFRTIKDGDKRLILIGGSEHKTGTKQDISKSYINLEEKAKELYPDMKVVYRWSTQDCMALDNIPYIGVFSDLMKNVFIATGFNKWGMTSSYIAADIIRDLINNNKNEYAEVFYGTRFHPVLNAKELADMGKEIGKGITGFKNPRCSHLGCELQWNELEKTWDCPCHGSRFSKEGKSLHSPSIKDLEL